MTALGAQHKNNYVARYARNETTSLERWSGELTESRSQSHESHPLA